MVENDRLARLHPFDTSVPDRPSAIRAQNFIVQQIAGHDGDDVRFASSDEIILILPDAGGILKRRGADRSDRIDERGVVIVPPGTHHFSFTQSARLFVLATDRSDLRDDDIANAETYRVPDDRVAPVGAPFVRIAGAGEVQILPIASVPHPATNPRLKFLQSATMSINWVEYAAPRDRTSLSPHAHDDLEQGSLAIDGAFVHHLRTPWGKNADLWRDDVHADAGPSSLLIVPPSIIHTTEGVGTDRHLLIDVFAPPRRDFIDKNWMFNAGDYRDPQAD